jgi:hypothetical protein
MLSKDPSKRYQTVSELQQELEEFLLNNNMRVNHYDISEYLEDVFEIN